jgi:bisphosphoglycerate-dependent phosphoglycerate mutase
MSVCRVVVVRHGESTFNAENRFTGWIDCGLTGVGVRERHKPPARSYDRHAKRGITTKAENP